MEPIYSRDTVYWKEARMTICADKLTIPTNSLKISVRKAALVRSRTADYGLSQKNAERPEIQKASDAPNKESPQPYSPRQQRPEKWGRVDSEQ